MHASWPATPTRKPPARRTPDGCARRLYAVDPQGLRQASEWLSPFERFWRGSFAALGTELARGKREQRIAAQHDDNARSATTNQAPGRNPSSAAAGSPHRKERS